MAMDLVCVWLSWPHTVKGLVDTTAHAHRIVCVGRKRPTVWFPWSYTVKSLVALAMRIHGFSFHDRAQPKVSCLSCERHGFGCPGCLRPWVWLPWLSTGHGSGYHGLMRPKVWLPWMAWLCVVI